MKRQKLLSGTNQWSFKTVGTFKGNYNSPKWTTEKRKKKGKFLYGKISSGLQRISISFEPWALITPYPPFLSWATLEVVCLLWFWIAENSILLRYVTHTFLWFSCGVSITTLIHAFDCTLTCGAISKRKIKNTRRLYISKTLY